MKPLLLMFFVLLMYAADAQQGSVVVKVQNKTVTARLNEDNTGTLVINAGKKIGKNEKFTIYNASWREEKEWVRHFEIFDKTDNSIQKLSAVRRAYYEIPLEDLLKKLKKDQTYTLYTMALPADPKKAAAIRVRRMLVCNIIVK
jgi:hypothetical protein